MRRALPAVLLATVIALGAVIGTVRGGQAGAELTVPPVPRAATPAPEPPAAAPVAAKAGGPKQAFGHACGVCHTLKAAGATGLIGPDLDAVDPSAAAVRRAIRLGSIDGVMQPGLLRGREAREMAAYVARAAGRRR